MEQGIKIKGKETQAIRRMGKGGQDKEEES